MIAQYKVNVNNLTEIEEVDNYDLITGYPENQILHYNMKKQHFLKNEGGKELIFYCDCNNNIIDQVSGYDIWTQLLGSQSGFTPSYVLDPLDNTRYCIRKPSGNYRVPLWIGDYTRTSSPNAANTFVISNSTGLNDPNEVNRAWLASPTYGNHMVEFYWYCAQGTYSSSTTIFDSSGLANQNVNANNSGVALITRNDNYVVIRCRNNTSVNIDTVVGRRSTLAGKWYKCQFSYYYINSTQYRVFAEIYDGSTLLARCIERLTTPLEDTKTFRGFYCFLVDNPGNGNWALNTIDRIKEVKVFRLT